MKTVCIDQSKYRSDELVELIRDPDVRFVVPDAAVMEMCKSSDHWEATLRGSLKLLSAIPDRVLVAKDNGALLKAELTSGRPLIFDDVISDEATHWLRSLLGEVASGIHGAQFEAMQTEIDAANALVQEQHFNHDENLSDLRELLPTLESVYPEAFKKRLRSKGLPEDLYIAVISHVATTVLDDQTMGLTNGTVDSLMSSRSYTARWLWARVETVTRWIASGGVESVASRKITNSDVDRHYLVIGSYCTQLLTADKDMQRIDRLLRAALGQSTPWNTKPAEFEEAPPSDTAEAIGSLQTNNANAYEMSKNSDNTHQYLLAAIPALGFFCLFTYEQGRFAFFGIPRYFIDLPLSRIVTLSSGILLGMACLLAAALFSISLQRNAKKAVRLIGQLLFLFIFFAPITFINRPALAGVLITLCCCLGYLSDPARQLEKNSVKVSEKDGIDNESLRYREVMGRLGMSIFAFLYFGIFFFSFGYFFQSKAISYTVIRPERTFIVVGTLGSSYLLKEYDPKSKQLTPGFLVKEPNDEPYQMIEVEVGALKGEPLFKQKL